MNIYLLQRKQFSYDEYRAKVVVAENESRARELANKDVGDEGQIWTDESQVTCTIVDTKTEMVVLSDFRPA